MTSAPSTAWALRAPELAEWTLTHLVNRRDVWGRYATWTDRFGVIHKVSTAPAKSERGWRRLECSDLIQHYQGAPCAIMGLHSTSPDNTSRWVGGDVDLHDGTPAGATTPEVNFATALALREALRQRGIAALIEDSNGGGGFHLWAVFDAPVPTADVFALLQAIVAAVNHPCETFPKQASIATGGYGNWLRLPGRHHTRTHWSRFLAGDGHWLEGESAVDALLNAPINPARLVPAAPPAPAPTVVSVPVRRSELPSGTLEHRIAAYLAKVPCRAAGQNRNGAGFQFACWLVRDLDLSDAEALRWLALWNDGNTPPYPETKLCELVRDARRYGRRPLGSGLSESAPPAKQWGHAPAGERRALAWGSPVR